MSAHEDFESRHIGPSLEQEATMLHELGHVIGLEHTHIDDDGINQGDSIMSYEANEEDHYLPGDIAGLQEIFCSEGEK